MRTHIGFFGKVNSGKSSLINAIAGQEVSIVSDKPGTTTDPVRKAVELGSLGACLLIDTAGLDDDTELGTLREEKTWAEALSCDIAVIVMPIGNKHTGIEDKLEEFFKKNKIPIVIVDDINRNDIAGIKAKLIGMSSQIQQATILNGLVSPSDIVMLIMPQDKQAPRGRLILPQVTTLRELLDNHARTVCVPPEEMEAALDMLNLPPKLIITDSQVFDYVYERKPVESMLTSFSVLYAGLKGDIAVYTEGAKAIDSLKPGDRILIAESCSHAPMEEDIGRVKIPALIKKRIGGDIVTEVAAGRDFPKEISGYSLILQCGGCMVNRRQIMNRIDQAIEQGVPITNYGIAIAYLKGILDKIEK
ncbi:MAG: 50S ribosome-binding GTPase [Eubacterium sp.]|nr:50S ribosome-binding GTPase [Eubacterium sp.]